MMFEKQDEKFTAMAADPERRLAAIADLTHRRTLVFWCACVVSVATFALSFGGNSAGGAVAFGAAIHWMLVFKFESDLRLLRVIDRLEK